MQHVHSDGYFVVVVTYPTCDRGTHTRHGLYPRPFHSWSATMQATGTWSRDEAVGVEVEDKLQRDTAYYSVVATSGSRLGTFSRLFFARAETRGCHGGFEMYPWSCEF